MKKLVSLCLALSFLLSMSFLLVSCATDPTEELKKEPTVMTLSLNPEVEFLLDANGTVVSANALNEEGNLILNAAVFVGKTNEEAVKLFIDISTETGFLVSGTAEVGENKVEIAFSGDEAEKRYQAISDGVKKHLEDKGITAALENAEALGAEYLEDALEQCLPYLDEAKIAAMTYEEKLAALKESRLETAELRSEQLKEAYYAAKERAYEEAKLTYLKEHANMLAAAAFDGATKTYFEISDRIDALRKENLIDSDSPYQVALAAFRGAKTEFLNYRAYVATLPEGEVTEAIETHLAALETALDRTEEGLERAYESANALLDTAKEQLELAYDTAIGVISSLDANINTYLSEAEQTLTEGLDGATESFETAYADAVAAAKKCWTDMEEALKAGYTPNEE